MILNYIHRPGYEMQDCKRAMFLDMMSMLIKLETPEPTGSARRSSCQAHPIEKLQYFMRATIGRQVAGMQDHITGTFLPSLRLNLD